MKSVASSMAIREAGDLQLFGPLGGNARRPHTRHSDSRRVIERIVTIFKKNRTEDVGPCGHSLGSEL